MVLVLDGERTTRNKVKKKALICFFLGFLCVITAIFLTVVDTIQLLTSYRMQVKNGSGVHEFLKRPMHTMYLKVYLFNVTNHESFLSGQNEKLKVEEIGPFTYEETRYNDGLELDLEAGVIRYEPRTKLELILNMSVADPDLVNVNMPNIPFLGLGSTISTYPTWTRMGYRMLTSQLNSKPFVQKTVTEYIWGYEEPIVKMGHTLLPGIIHFDKIGVMDRLFDKRIKNRLEVGATVYDKFIVKTRNGHKKLNMGESQDPDECEICDDFKDAYEGLGYPSPVTPQTPIRLFRNGLCRILPMTFDKKIVTEEGFDGLVYNLSDSFYSLDPKVTENRMLDLKDCFFGLPVYLSKVHFLDIDPELYKRVDGMKPVPEKNSYIIIEPKIAMQLYSYFPVQVNLNMMDLSYLPQAKSFSNMVLPIGYVEIIQPPIPKITHEVLEVLYISFPRIILASKILSALVGVSLIIYSIILIRKQNREILMETSNEKQISVLEPFIAKRD